MSGKAPTDANWIVYVDGLNFYAAVRDRPETKWIDFRALADRLVPRDGAVSKVKYFTSQPRDRTRRQGWTSGRRVQPNGDGIA